MSPKIPHRTFKGTPRDLRARNLQKPLSASAHRATDTFNPLTNAGVKENLKINPGSQELADRSRKFEFFPSESTRVEELIARHNLPVSSPLK